MNTRSEESNHSQWLKYLQNKSYLVSLTHSLNKSLHEASAEQSMIMKESADMISDIFSEGMDEINEQIRKSSSFLAARIERVQSYIEQSGKEIVRFKELFDWRSALLIEEMRINNMLSADIAQLLRIPDSQKERQHLIERGLQFLSNARLDADLYHDALDFFHKAEAIERTDYYTLFRIGAIYLYAENCIDIQLAEKYFHNAGKYARIEADQGSIRLKNLLATSSGLETASYTDEQEQIKTLVVESFFHASIACYIQGKFIDAAEYAKVSYDLSSDFLESGYTYAKSLCALNDAEQAVPILKKIVHKEPGYVFKILDDPDIRTKPAILMFISQLRDEAVRNAEERLTECLGYIRESRYEEVVLELQGYCDYCRKTQLTILL